MNTLLPAGFMNAIWKWSVITPGTWEALAPTASGVRGVYAGCEMFVKSLDKVVV